MSIAASMRRAVRYWTPTGLLESYYRRANARGHSSSAGDGAATASLPSRIELTQAAATELFPGIDTGELTLRRYEIFDRHFFALPLLELFTVASIARHLKPMKIFEIGTYTGSTTVAIADNTPPETRIWTLDLKDEDLLRTGAKSRGGGQFSVGSAFRNTTAAPRIQQLFSDSRAFDFSPYYGQMDLVFIDANHSYEFARSDSIQAKKLIRPGGIIIWDDFVWRDEHPECVGVSQAVSELFPGRALQIADTRLAIYIDPAAKAV